jgi:2-polyprenyl-6-methoxyphenol hydroxylase-like FAD-dependent oxidoreductase
MIQIQPRLGKFTFVSVLASMPLTRATEKTLRHEISKSSWCTVRTGCEVVSRSSEDPPTIEYVDKDGSPCQIRGQWLIGADGKLGIVRKHFLEPTAGIKQLDGSYPYSGTWVAANLRMIVPTPESHPDFPLWELGYSSDEVYDLFWPVGWHFCSPPGKATACGRFGPHSERLWRHEFRQDKVSDDMNLEKLLWEHLTPMITLDGNRSKGHKFNRPVQYPRDCIEILRCRPFNFVHKVVNRWFHKKTIVIGDAAHVFPPFAGQGIASGVRDAQQLSWRLALLLKTDAPSNIEQNMLNVWANERRNSVDEAASMSKLNGTVCNYPPPFWLLAALRIVTFLNFIPFFRNLDPQALTEKKGFSQVNGGFHLKQYKGGARLAQIYVRSPCETVPILSDSLLRKVKTIFKILIISDGMEEDKTRLWEEACAAIDGAALNPAALSRESILIYDPVLSSSNASPKLIGNQSEALVASVHTFAPARRADIEYRLSPHYNIQSYIDRIGRSTKFVIARPDFFVFACARNSAELIKCLALLKERIDGVTGI